MVSVTPGNPTYAVSITSPEVGGYDFGSVNLGASTISTLGIVVKSSGTISEYFAMSVTADGGWTPVVVDSAAPAYNKFELQGHFAAAQPLDSSFDAGQRPDDDDDSRHGIDLVQPGRADDPGQHAEPVAEAEDAGGDGLEPNSACSRSRSTDRRREEERR